MIDPNGILMVEPEGLASAQPVVDELTRKITAAWRAATHSEYSFRGCHVCECGAKSDSKHHWIGDLLTNSLCVHYVAHHRSQIPDEELAKVATLSFGEAEPTPEELKTRR